MAAITNPIRVLIAAMNLDFENSAKYWISVLSKMHQSWISPSIKSVSPMYLPSIPISN